MKEYMSVKQVAARLNGAVSLKHVYRLIERGKLRVNRELGKILVEEDSLEELLNPTPQPAVVVPEPTPVVVPPKPQQYGRGKKRKVVLR